MPTEDARPTGALYLEQNQPPPSRRWQLTGERMAIGRAPSSHICVTDVRVSWHHARLERDGAAWSILDEGSTNGTFVNGARIREAPLEPRDRIRLGQVELIVRQDNVEPGTHRENLSPASPLWWWNRVTKTVLTAGAIASAVAAIFGLFASHPTENMGRFTGIQLISQTPLSELQQRSAGFTAHLSSGRTAGGASPAALLDDAPPSPGEETTPAGGPSASPATSPFTAPQPSSSTAGGPGGAGSPAGTGSPTGTGSPPDTSVVSPGAPHFGGILVSPAPGTQRAAANDYEGKVAQVLHLSSCAPGSLCGEFIVSASAYGPTANGATQRPVVTNGSENLVSPEVAAKRITGILGQTRTVAEGASRAKVPLGELVSVNVELAGLRGRPVFLIWSIFQAGGRTSLYGKWLQEFIAYRLVATTDDDTGSVEVWIPLPAVPGPFFARLTLSTDGANLTSEDSGTFG